MRSVLLLLFALALTAPGPSARAAEAGLPVPRFVSLRSDEVNVRTGPGVRYPIDWVFVRKTMPVEVLAEVDTWRKVRSIDGTEGWVHQSMLSARRMVVVIGPQRHLRAEPDDKSLALALVEANVMGRPITCPRAKPYCKVDVNNIQGWLKRDEFWGVYAGEFIE